MRGTNRCCTVCDLMPPFVLDDQQALLSLHALNPASPLEHRCIVVYVAIRAPFVRLLCRRMLSACKGLELRGWVRAVHGHWDYEPWEGLL